MSTAKSMANSYLSGKRNGTNRFNNLPTRFKSSTSNLASSSHINNSHNGRQKSTSMTNLIAGDHSTDPNNNNNSGKAIGVRIQRPASRNALDSIHNGMNAKYAQVQSKVLLQNIRPNVGSNNPNTISKSKSNTLQATGSSYGSVRSGRHTPTSLAGPVKVPSDRTQLINKLKALQEEIDRHDEERENFKHELEREKADKLEQIQQLKQELQDKLAEHDKQHEEYHQKLLEAYELADQNRRAADTVLNESRQRDEESRKRIEELESQLSELKEFVTMKEEMTGKMYELKEQIREERKRYEEQLKSLHQVFENEKLRLQEVEAKGSNSSNYFKRIKPSLQSNESINGIGECPKCSKSRGIIGGQQMHRSEHDIYGSKLSTRMQDTARSAWKASKHFASSVITGKAVGISACRKKTSTKSNDKEQANIPTHMTGPFEEQLTSVVKVESTGNNYSGLGGSANSGGDQVQPSQSLIRVDQNNKLTIVTKFNDSDCGQSIATTSSPNQVAEIIHHHQSSGQASIPTPNSTTGESERSRCESSSSGRGTSSDACSSSSQNGDEEHHHSNEQTNKLNNGLTPIAKECLSQIANRQKQPSDGNNNIMVVEAVVSNKRDSQQQHRRKSSIFKPSKVLGSQANLNKWRYFFTGKESNGSAKISQPIEVDNKLVSSPQEQNVDQQHLENSRLRCMELNRAIRTPSLPIEAVTKEVVDGDNIERKKVAGAVFEKCQQDIEKLVKGEQSSGNESKASGEEEKAKNVGQGEAKDQASGRSRKQEQQDQQQPVQSLVAAS